MVPDKKTTSYSSNGPVQEWSSREEGSLGMVHFIRKTNNLQVLQFVTFVTELDLLVGLRSQYLEPQTTRNKWTMDVPIWQLRSFTLFMIFYDCLWKHPLMSGWDWVCRYSRPATGHTWGLRYIGHELKKLAHVATTRAARQAGLNPTLGIQVPSQVRCLGWVWRVQVPSEKVLGSLGPNKRTCQEVGFTW